MRLSGTRAGLLAAAAVVAGGGGGLGGGGDSGSGGGACVRFSRDSGLVPVTSADRDPHRP